MKELRFGMGLWIYAQVPDRYLPSGYQENGNLDTKLEMVAKTEGVTAIEMPFGSILTLDNIDQVGKQVKNAGISVCALSVNVTGDKKWKHGSITNPDKFIRNEAKDRIKQSIQAAEALGVNVINLWMGQEGFDYPFEINYSDVWKMLTDGISECANECKTTNLSIEFKRMEPRARSLPNSTSQALLIALSAECDKLGITLDIGHALLGGENASQSARLLSDYKKLFYVHINDNYADWDWDMAAGVNHWWQLVEFCFWMQETEYEGHLVLDIFPYRQDPLRCSELSVKAFRRAWEIAEKLDRDFIFDAMNRQDAITVYEKLLEIR